MNRFLRSTAAFVTAAVMLSGCTAPGMNNNGGKRHEMSDSYSYTPEEEQRSEQAYTWLIKPSIQAEQLLYCLFRQNSQPSKVYHRKDTILVLSQLVYLFFPLL